MKKGDKSQMSNVICGVDKDGRVYPLGVKYDEGTGIASLAISRGAGKNTFSAEYAVSQTNEILVDVPATQKICVASVFVCGAGTTGDVYIHIETSGTLVFKHYMTKYNQSFATDMHVEGELGEDLLLTTTTDTDKVFIIVNYRLIS